MVFACAACTIYGAETEFFVINPSSKSMGIPATSPSAAFGNLKNGSYSLAGTAPPPAAVDVFGNKLYCLPPAEAMSSTKWVFVGKPAAADVFLKVTADTGKPIEVQTENCTYRVSKDFVEMVSHGKTSRFSIDAFTPKLVFKGVNIAVIGGSAGASKEHIEIYRTGIAKISGCKDLKFDSSTPLRSIQARKADYGVSQAADSRPLAFPEDWWRIEETPNTLGVVVCPDYGTIGEGKGNSIALQGSSVSAWVAPADNDKEAWSVRVKTHPCMIARSDGEGGFHGAIDVAGQSANLKIIDRNSNKIPDMDGDLWLWSTQKVGKPLLALAYSQSPDASSGKRVCIFKTDKQDLTKSVLDETPADISKIPPDGKTLLKPKVIIEDWNNDGIFLRGSLVFGGFLGADRYSKDGEKWITAYDLNGDNLGDVFEVAKGHYIFNFQQDIVSLLDVSLDPIRASVGVSEYEGYEMQKRASMFSKTTDIAGRTFKGAIQAFEEHFFVNVRPEENPKVWKNGASFFYYANGGGNVNRMTMGRLDGSKELRSWNIEMDPVPVDEEVNWNIVSLKDAAGHELKLHTISVPQSWDGTKQGFRGFYQGWYSMVEGKYRTTQLFACFASQGTNFPFPEGMYGGAFTTDGRIEVDEHGGTYDLYFSPLMNALHLKGAGFGTYAVPADTPDFWLDINRYYHREAQLGNHRFVGAQPGLLWRQHEAKRLIGTVFLSYSDEDGDGRMDNYIYDIDNDGIYDRMLRYNDKSGVISLTDKYFTAAWPLKVKFIDVKYLPEKYDEISALYQRGLGRAPMVASLSIGSSGTPVNIVTKPFYKEEIPPFFVTFGRRWQTVVASDMYHCGGIDPWTDFGPGGISRIGSMFAKRGIVQKALTSTWTDESLKSIDVLLLPTLTLTPSEMEIQALKRWIENGGICIASTVEAYPAWMRFAALGSILGFTPGNDFLQMRTPLHMTKGLGGIRPEARASETRTPGPWNQIKHFTDPLNLGLLAGFDYLSFTGYSLDTLTNGLQPLLCYDEKPLMALANIGKGKLLVSGIDLWTNRYIWHHEFYEGGAKNDRLVERIVSHLADALPTIEVSEMKCTPEKITMHISGKGGPMRFSRSYDLLSDDLPLIGDRAAIAKKGKFSLDSAAVNGQLVPIMEVGSLEEIPLPAGNSTVEITYRPVSQ